MKEENPSASFGDIVSSPSSVCATPEVMIRWVFCLVLAGDVFFDTEKLVRQFRCHGCSPRYCVCNVRTVGDYDGNSVIAISFATR